MDEPEKLEELRKSIEAQRERQQQELVGSDFGQYLAMLVPLYIEELILDGGVKDRDLEQARVMGEWLAYRGDILLYGGRTTKEKNERKENMPNVAKAVAVLSFSPGGVKLFGQHWEAASYAKLMGLSA